MEPELITKVVIQEISEYPPQLSRFSNLTELVLSASVVEIERLKASPNLKYLAVQSFHETRAVVSFPTIQSLIIKFEKIGYANHLPAIVSRCFPNLYYFEFNVLVFTKMDVFNLPSSCKFVKTTPKSLYCFFACESIENLILTYPGLNSLDKLDMFRPNSPRGYIYPSLFYDQTKKPVMFLRNPLISNLKNTSGMAKFDLSLLHIIYNGESYFTLSALLHYIFDLLTFCKSLQVLKVDPGFFGTPSLEISIQKLIMGEIEDEFDNFNLRFKLGESCRNSNIQLLILGKNAIMKESASAELLRKFDNFQFEYTLMIEMEACFGSN